MLGTNSITLVGYRFSPSINLKEKLFFARVCAPYTLDSSREVALEKGEEGMKRFLSLKHVKERVTLSRSQINRLIQAGRFPAPYQISAGRKAWLETDVEAWINTKLTQSDEQSGRTT